MVIPGARKRRSLQRSFSEQAVGQPRRELPLYRNRSRFPVVSRALYDSRHK